MPTLTQTRNTFLNKWVIIALIGLIIYLTGGSNLIRDNPILLIFVGLVFVVIYVLGK